MNDITVGFIPEHRVFSCSLRQFRDFRRDHRDQDACGARHGLVRIDDTAVQDLCPVPDGVFYHNGKGHVSFGHPRESPDCPVHVGAVIGPSIRSRYEDEFGRKFIGDRDAGNRIIPGVPEFKGIDKFLSGDRLGHRTLFFELQPVYADFCTRCLGRKFFGKYSGTVDDGGALHIVFDFYRKVHHPGLTGVEVVQLPDHCGAVKSSSRSRDEFEFFRQDIDNCYILRREWPQISVGYMISENLSR